jgi:hypothetical protein
MGNRYRGGIQAGAMPPLHRYLGNPLLTAIGRLFFRSGCGDFYCGLRGFDRQAILSLDLQARGMEFALEMLVKATVLGLRVTEVPTTLAPDGRGRPPHLQRWRDGWRSLRFFLLFSPRSLFLYPGFVLFTIGCLGMAWLLPRPRLLGGVGLDVHSLLYASLAIVVGFQSMMFWVFAKLYGMRERIVPPDAWFRSLMSFVTLEAGLAGAVLLLVGLALALFALGIWGAKGFGALAYAETMRLVIPSSTAILLGFQIIYGAFFVSILEIRASRPTEGTASDRSADAAW